MAQGETACLGPSAPAVATLVSLLGLETLVSLYEDEASQLPLENRPAMFAQFGKHRKDVVKGDLWGP